MQKGIQSLRAQEDRAGLYLTNCVKALSFVNG